MFGNTRSLLDFQISGDEQRDDQSDDRTESGSIGLVDKLCVTK